MINKKTPICPHPSRLRKSVLTALSVALVLPTPAAFAQYKYKAYVKDLLATSAPLVTPPPSEIGQLSITPTTYEFANTPKNSTSEAVFTAKNISTNSAANIALGAPALSNTNGFSYIATCPPILPPQASCQIRVLFTPSTSSTFTTALSFPSANASAPLPSSSIVGQGLASAITFSANPLNFPDTDISTPSAPHTLTIINTGGNAQTIASLSATAPYAISSHTCGDTLSPAQSCTATLTFSPTTVGSNPSLFSFNTATQTYTTSLTGNGLGPVITITPSAITGVSTLDTSPTTPSAPQSVAPPAFKPLALGTPADPNLNYKKLTSTTTITNSGTKPLTDLTLSYSAFSTTSPYISTTCPSTLPVGTACTVSLWAYRHLKNKHTGFLSLSGTAIPTKQIPVSLDIATILPANTVVSDTTFYDFGSVVVYQPSTPKRITFSYFGNSTATITAAPTPTVVLSNNTCEGVILLPNKTCSVDVAVSPSTPRPNAITTWMPSYTIGTAPAPTSLTHQFTYTGLGDILSLDPAALTTSTTTTAVSSSSYILSNAGNRATPVTLFHAPTSTSLPFTLNTSACSTLQPKASCTLTVVASATTEGPHTGTLTIQGTTSSITAPTSLTVSDAPKLTLSTTDINFGTIVQGATVSSQSVQLSNIGASPAMLGTLSTTSPFTLFHNCPPSLPALTACTLSFGIDTTSEFPEQSAALSDAVSLATTQPYAKIVDLSASLQGTIVNNIGDVTLSPPSATFSYTPPNQQSTPKTFTINNTNSYELPFTPAIIGVDASQYALSNNTCPDPIPANSSCTVNVSYTPDQPELTTPQMTYLGLLYEGAITLTSELIASDIPVNSLSFNPLNFNSANPTTGSNIQHYYYTNTSANPLTFTPQLQIGSRFSVLNHTCTSLAPQAACKITVHAKTDTEGNFSDTLSANGTLITLSSNVFTFPTLSFSKAGAPITTLDYGIVSHKKPLHASLVQLHNSTATDATLSPINFQSFSGISQTNNCSGTPNTTGILCNFTFNVTPSTVASPLNADSYNWFSTLNVSTADGLSTTSLPIKGTAVVGTHSLPPSIDFGTLYLGTSTSRPLTITNTSTNLAEISTTAVIPDAADITSNTPCLNTWLTPGQTCNATLTFSPTTPGNRSGTISLGIIGKSNQSRSVPWTASVLVGFNTETALSPNSWAPSTTVGTSRTQLITFTNTYYLPLTVAAPTYSASFPDGLTIASNNCSGQTIQPQATCTMTLQFSATSAFEKFTSSTLNFALTPVNQTVSLTIPSAYASLGNPVISALQLPGYPDGYAVNTDVSAVQINGSGFATGITGTKIYVNGTQITTSAPPSGPFKGWSIFYSGGATATTRITLAVPANTPTGDYTVTAHNIGSTTDSSATLRVANGPAVLTLSQTAQTATGPVPTAFLSSTYLVPNVPVSTPYTHTATFTNTGGLPYTFPGTPTAYPPAGVSTVAVPYSAVVSNTCTGLTFLQPTQSCSVVSSIVSSDIASPQHWYMGEVMRYERFFPHTLNMYPTTGSYGSTISSALATPLNGYTAETETTSLINFGPLLVGTPRIATITVQNTSTYASQSFTPSFSGNPSFSIVSETCSTATTPLSPGLTCEAVISVNPPTAQGPISATLTFASSLGKPASITLSGNSVNAQTSAGIDLSNLSHYFPLTYASSLTNTGYSSGPLVDTKTAFSLPYYIDGAGIAYQANTPFNPSVPAHTTPVFRYGVSSQTWSITGFRSVFASSTLITGTTDFSLSAWIRGSGGEILAQSQGTQPSFGTESKQTFKLYKDPWTGSLCFQYGDGTTFANGQLFCTTATVAPTPPQWTHAALTKSGQTITLHLNGSNQSFTATTPLNLSTYSGTTVGWTASHSITDLGVFKNRILTPSEITQIYSSHAPLIAK